jgi:hypothetical protein
MSEPALQVEAARIPDRDRLVELLREHGVEARPVDEVTIEVSPGDDADAASDDLFREVEGLVLEIGAPFVPQKHEGVIYIRPPVN